MPWYSVPIHGSPAFASDGPRERDLVVEPRAHAHDWGLLLSRGEYICFYRALYVADEPLQAAIILSASVTFISLPGVDDVARIAALLAILCSTASMASTVLALFRYKADIERAPFASGEGFVFLTVRLTLRLPSWDTFADSGFGGFQRRSILMSLPLVFLAWAVIAFVTGISVYSFRGIALTVPGLKFGVATQWAVACALGGLIGMLIISALFVR